MGFGLMSRSHNGTQTKAVYTLEYQARKIDAIKRMRISYPDVLALNEVTKITVREENANKI